MSDDKPKSKRGGARPNTGGKRPGAGRPKKAPEVLLAEAVVAQHEAAEKVQGRVVESDPEVADTLPTTDDPKVFLLAVMNHPKVDGKLRIDAAKSVLPFVHQKLGEGGKKEEKANAAKKAGAGRFGAAAPPKLVVNNGR
jgi:phage terminase small subunit